MVDEGRCATYDPAMSPFTPGRAHRITKITAGILVCALLFAGGVGVGLTYGNADALGKTGISLSDLHKTITGSRVNGVGAAPPSDIAQDVDFSQFWEVWRDLRAQFYEQPVNEHALLYGAIRGMVAAVEDPYTSFFEPEQSETFLDDLSGEFSGIGAEIGIRDGELQIIAPLPDSPAEKAGIRARDLIVEIDGEMSIDLTVEEAVQKIRGPKGTTVTLKLGRVNTAAEDSESGILETVDISIVRDTITIQSLYVREEEPGLFVIELRSFNADTGDDFRAAIKQIQQKGARGLILDVRNDPGGYLDIAVDIASAWLGNDVVVQERKRGEITDQYYGSGKGDLRGIKTVVLVNEGSASASEIVAGALQDKGVATIVGTQTFGKGSVQEFQEYPDGSALKVTVAEWLTPNGRSINHEGITPDIVVEFTEEDFTNGNDPQLQKALELLRTGQAKP